MVHEEKKVAKIIEELTMFFFTVGSDEIETCIKRDEHSDVIWIRANYNPEYRDELDYLEEFLNKEKNDGLEDIYWELAGSGDPGETSQLLLIGMMIDSHEIHHYGNEIELILYKNKEYEW